MHLPISTGSEDSPSKQAKAFQLKIKKLVILDDKGKPNSSNDKASNQSYAASIERAILSSSRSEESTDDSIIHNGSMESNTSSLNTSSASNKSLKGKRTRNVPVKNKQSDTKATKTKGSKLPKKVSAKKFKVTSARRKQSKKACATRTSGSETDADMPKIEAIFENSPTKPHEKPLGSPKKSAKKRKLFEINSAEEENNLNSSFEECSGEQRKRLLFPKRASNLRKQKIIEEFSQSRGCNEKKSPSKSILVNRNNAKSPKKRPPPKSTTREQEKTLEENPPKKKVKFESTQPMESLDLSMDHSIETLTELVRQKRIRPPYGQPYSVTGSWYIASGYLQDLASLLEKFIAQADSRFTSFADCWRQMSFSQIYRGRESFKELLEFSEEVVVLTKKYLEKVHSEKRRIGALYTLYSLYYKHPVRHNFFLRFTVSQYQDLVALVKRQPHFSNPDPARILMKLHADSAIHQTATDNELCIGLHTAYNSSNVRVEYGFFRLAQSSNVPRALPDLATDDKLVKEYHRVKTAANNEPTSDDTRGPPVGPDRALSLFNASCCDEAKQELLQLQDFTLTLLSFKGQHAVHSRPPLHSDPLLSIGKKRYAIKERATSIAESEAKLLESESGTSPPGENLDFKVLKRAPKPTVYVGKVEITNDDEELGGERAFEKIPPSKYGYKGPWEPLVGQTVVKRKRGRNPLYVNPHDKSLLSMPLSAAKVSLLDRNRRDRILQKLSQRKDTSLTLGVKSLGVCINPPMEENRVASLPSIGASTKDEAFYSHSELDNLGETVGPDDDVDGALDINDITDSMKSKRDQSMLEMRVQIIVNGKREVRNVKANISAAQFEHIKNDPIELKKLHEKLMTMMLPKLRFTHGKNVKVNGLQIVKTQRCKPDTVKPRDFLTSNQPFIKSGSYNIKLRMKMMEKFQQKTPVQSKVEAVNEATQARATLVPIAVGGELKYIQSSVEEHANETTLANTSSSWQVNSVLRSHNCNWKTAKKITNEFKTFKSELNKITVNASKIQSITDECPSNGNWKIQRFGFNENDSQCKSSSRGPDASYLVVSSREKEFSNENERAKRKQKNKNKVKSVTNNGKTDQTNGDSSQKDEQNSQIPDKRKKSKKNVTVKSTVPQKSCKNKRTSQRGKRIGKTARMSVGSTTIDNSSAKIQFFASSDAENQDVSNNDTSISYKARIPWHSTVVPDTDFVTESVTAESSEPTENWPDSLLLSPETEKALTADEKECQNLGFPSNSTNATQASESVALTISDIQNDWDCEPKEIVDEAIFESKVDDVTTFNESRNEQHSTDTEYLNTHDWNDEESSIVDMGTDGTMISQKHSERTTNAFMNPEFLDQLEENGASVSVTPEVENGSMCVQANGLQNGYNLAAPSTGDIAVQQTEPSSSFPVELPPVLTLNLPVVSNTFPIYNSSPLPVILPPTSLTEMQPTAYLAPSNQPFIRAHTQDGMPVILPPNICFSIIGSDGNGMNVRFNNSSESLIIPSQPVLQPAVPNNALRFITTNPSNVVCESNSSSLGGQCDQFMALPAVPVTEASAFSNATAFSADVSANNFGSKDQEGVDSPVPKSIDSAIQNGFESSLKNGLDSVNQTKMGSTFQTSPGYAVQTGVDSTAQTGAGATVQTDPDSAIQTGVNSAAQIGVESEVQTPDQGVTDVHASSQQSFTSSIDLLQKSSVGRSKTSESPPLLLRRSPRKNYHSPGSLSSTASSPKRVSNTRSYTDSVRKRGTFAMSATAVSPLKSDRTSNVSAKMAPNSSSPGKRTENHRLPSFNTTVSGKENGVEGHGNGEYEVDGDVTSSNSTYASDGTNVMGCKPQPADPVSLNTTITDVGERPVSMSDTRQTVRMAETPSSDCMTQAVSMAETPQAVRMSGTPQTNRKSVCSFLVANKFKNLGSAFGAKGCASGKPTPPKKTRVSFFRKGALTKPSQAPPRIA